jgi:hypothetical protein
LNGKNRKMTASEQVIGLYPKQRHAYKSVLAQSGGLHSPFNDNHNFDDLSWF